MLYLFRDPDLYRIMKYSQGFLYGKAQKSENSQRVLHGKAHNPAIYGAASDPEILVMFWCWTA